MTATSDKYVSFSQCQRVKLSNKTHRSTIEMTQSSVILTHGPISNERMKELTFANKLKLSIAKRKLFNKVSFCIFDQFLTQSLTCGFVIIIFFGG